MTKDEALDLALEALEYIDREDNDRDFLFPFQCAMLDKAITAIKQARSAPVQEQPCQHLRTISDGSPENEYCYDCKKFIGLASPPTQPAPVPDYAWPTVADYEKDVGFAVNDTFKAAWNMARTTNDLFTQMEKPNDPM